MSQHSDQEYSELLSYNSALVADIQKLQLRISNLDGQENLYDENRRLNQENRMMYNQLQEIKSAHHIIMKSLFGERSRVEI